MPAQIRGSSVWLTFHSGIAAPCNTQVLSGIALFYFHLLWYRSSPTKDLISLRYTARCSCGADRKSMGGGTTKLFTTSDRGQAFWSVMMLGIQGEIAIITPSYHSVTNMLQNRMLSPKVGRQHLQLLRRTIVLEFLPGSSLEGSVISWLAGIHFFVGNIFVEVWHRPKHGGKFRTAHFLPVLFLLRTYCCCFHSVFPFALANSPESFLLLLESLLPTTSWSHQNTLKLNGQHCSIVPSTNESALHLWIN